MPLPQPPLGTGSPGQEGLLETQDKGFLGCQGHLGNQSQEQGSVCACRQSEIGRGCFQGLTFLFRSSLFCCLKPQESRYPDPQWVRYHVGNLCPQPLPQMIFTPHDYVVSQGFTEHSESLRYIPEVPCPELPVWLAVHSPASVLGRALSCIDRSMTAELCREESQPGRGLPLPAPPSAAPRPNPEGRYG